MFIEDCEVIKLFRLYISHWGIQVIVYGLILLFELVDAGSVHSPSIPSSCLGQCNVRGSQYASRAHFVPRWCNSMGGGNKCGLCPSLPPRLALLQPRAIIKESCKDTDSLSWSQLVEAKGERANYLQPPLPYMPRKRLSYGEAN